ncbi:MAG: beta strand repeat-containing protein [Candidatus Kapaibacterium sp.]
MRKKITLFIILLIVAGPFSSVVFSQENVGIGTEDTPASPDPSAILHLDFRGTPTPANPRGFLLPRMSTSQMNGITNPATGLIIYNTDDDNIYYNEGTSGSPNWVRVLNTGGTISFDRITGATNTTADMIVGTGASLSPAGTGYIESNRFVGSGSASDAVDLATAEVSGTLPINNGGTNSNAAPTSGAIAYGDGSGYEFSAAGTNGYLLTSGGSGAPTWTDPANFLTSTTAAGGDLTGNYPDPDVAGLRGRLISTTAPGDGQLLKWNGTTSEWEPVEDELGAESVGLVMPAEFQVSNSPVTASGDLTVSWANAAANTVFAGPDGVSGAPEFRALLENDIPDLSTDKITSGILPIERGGTNTNDIPTAGAVAYGTGSEYAFTAAGTAGHILQSNAAAAPEWVDPATVLTGSFWTLSGNDITDPSAEFIGTTTDQNLVFRTGGSGSGNTRMTINSPTNGGDVIITDGLTVSNNGITVTGASSVTGNTTITGNMALSNGSNNNTLITSSTQAVDLNYTLPETAPSTDQYLSATGVTGSDVTLGWASPAIIPSGNLEGEVLRYDSTNAVWVSDSDMLFKGNDTEARVYISEDSAGAYSALRVESSGTGTNTALRLNATGGSDNYALVVENGNAGFGTTTPSRTLDVNGTARIGQNGTTLTNIIRDTVNITATNVNTNSHNDVTVTVTNAEPGSSVIVSPSVDFTDGVGIGYAYVSAANTVKIRFINVFTSARTVPAQDYYITIIK